MLIDGLYVYELVLLALGFILFITLLVLLIIYAVQRRSLKGLVVFFLFPILMIGYPGIQKIEYDNGVIRIEKLARDIAANPDSPQAKEELTGVLATIEEKPTSNPDTFLKFSEARAALGDTVKAVNLAEQALRLKPRFPAAENLIQQYNTPRVKIERLAGEVERNPNNNGLRMRLADQLGQYRASIPHTTLSLTTAAQAYAALRDTTHAVAFADSALRRDHTNRAAFEVRRRMVERVSP